MATGENRVRWADLDPNTYEDMVAVLLSYLHPGLVRIDGSGGDGGRDCYWDTSAGREAFELKSFTGRLGHTQRRQVERSLARAEAYHPVSWHLVVPIDPTPKEDEWFEKLCSKYDFPLTWYGLTWLDGQMALRPYLYRYFVEGTAEEILDRLAELVDDKAAVAAGIPHAVERLGSIRKRLNEIDPYYEFSVTVSERGHEVRVTPRYAGAERDRPITGTVHGTFPDTEEGNQAGSEFSEALGFGLPYDLSPDYVDALVVDAPGALGGRLTGGSVSFRPIDDPLEMPFHFRVSDVDGQLLAQLPITITQRSSGAAGAILNGSDESGWLKVTMKFHKDDRRVEINYRTQLEGAVLPGDLGPALAFTAVLHRPNLLSVYWPERSATIVSDLVIDADPIVDAKQRKVIDDLATLQRASGVYFDLPDNLTGADMREIDEGVRLLAGESVAMTWRMVTITITPIGEEPRVVLQAAKDEGWVGTIRANSSISVTIGGHVIPLGNAVLLQPSVRITNGKQVVEQWTADPAEIPVKLECLEPVVATLERGL